MLANNVRDMAVAVKELRDLVDGAAEFISEPIVDAIENVISEWSNHLETDVDEAMEKLGDQADRISELEDCEKACDNLDSQLEDRNQEIDELNSEIHRLHAVIAELE